VIFVAVWERDARIVLDFPSLYLSFSFCKFVASYSPLHASFSLISPMLGSTSPMSETFHQFSLFLFLLFLAYVLEDGLLDLLVE
jgi:hypothetical protein